MKGISGQHLCSRGLLGDAVGTRDSRSCGKNAVTPLSCAVSPDSTRDETNRRDAERKREEESAEREREREREREHDRVLSL